MQKSSCSGIFQAWDSAGAGPRGWCLGDSVLRCDVHRALSSWMRMSVAGMGRGDAAFGPYVATVAPRGIIPSDLEGEIS